MGKFVANHIAHQFFGIIEQVSREAYHPLACAMTQFFQSAPYLKSSHRAAFLLSHLFGKRNDIGVGKALCHSLHARYDGALGSTACNVALQRNSHKEALRVGVEAEVVELAVLRLTADFKVVAQARNHLPLVESCRSTINFFPQSLDFVVVHIERVHNPGFCGTWWQRHFELPIFVPLGAKGAHTTACVDEYTSEVLVFNISAKHIL